MSQQTSLKRPSMTPNADVGSSTGCSSTPHKRRRQTNQALKALGQLVRDTSTDEVDNKINKNDVLSLTLARLLRRKYWPSKLGNKNVQLATAIQSSSIDDDLNGFIVVMNTKGRIVLMSDNVEYYLRKNVRALYPQLTNIYDFVSKDDHESIRNILSRPTDLERRIVCTWNLARGKRPSRNHTESKSMLMTGHFCFLNDAERTENQEPLFVARCEQILSSVPNVPANSIGSTSTTTLRFVLTDQLNITEVPSNVESLMGYRAEELIDQSINRFIPLEYLHVLEQARHNCIMGQHYTTMNVIDLYTRDGDRLTFLCNTHMLIEGRRKAVKLGFLAQLIDPLARDECVMYANRQNLERLRTTVQQEAMLISNSNLNTLGSSTISSKHDQCLNLTQIATVCPATIIPPRRKRRRLNLKNGHEQSGEQLQETPQLNNDFHESYVSSSDSLTSSSPIQELGYSNDFLQYFDDVVEQDKIKYIHDFPSIDDVNDLLGMNNNQSLLLLTPTMSTLNFFA